MVRLAIKHSADGRTRVVVIEHDELNGWIDLARKHGFSVEAKSIGQSAVGKA
jgi:type II secretory pathway component PulL